MYTLYIYIRLAKNRAIKKNNAPSGKYENIRKTSPLKKNKSG